MASGFSAAQERKVFTVTFIGVHRRGHAVVLARCKRHAKLVLMDKLARVNTELHEANLFDKTGQAIDLKQFCIVIPSSRITCTILDIGEE